MHRLIVAAALVLVSCGSPSARADDSGEFASVDSGKGSESGDEPAERASFDDDAAREAAKQEVADEGYDGPCTIDCSGHDAGFNWAADGHDDGGISNSRSFDEGQEAYEDKVEERLNEKRQTYEDGDPEAE